MDDLLQEHAELFMEELGVLRKQETDIVIPSDTKPIFCRTRPVTHALREKIEQELTWLQDASVIEPIQYSDCNLTFCLCVYILMIL